MDGAIDVLRQGFEIWRGFHSGPENAGALFAGEETEAVEIESDRLGRMDGGENFLKWCEFGRVRVSKEFQSHVEIFGAHPFNARREGGEFLEEGGKCGADIRRDLDGDEETHAGILALISADAARLRIGAIEEVETNDVESYLRSVEADHFAIASEVDEALLDATRKG